MRHFFAIALSFTAAIAVMGAKVELTADHENCLYAAGEEAVVTITVNDVSPSSTTEMEVTISWNDGEETEVKTFPAQEPAELKLTRDCGFALITAAYPAEAEQRTTASIGIGFAPEKITPIMPERADFDEFWLNAKDKINNITPDTILEPLPEFSTDEYTSYRISFANINNTRIHGFLSVPTAEGKFPVYFSVPGAGPNARSPMINEYKVPNDRTITLVMNVFPFPMPTDLEEARAKLKEMYGDGYYAVPTTPDAEKAFFYRALIGIDFALDFIAAHDKSNGNVVYWGSSQGGAAGLALAALNDNIKALALNVPARFDKHFVYAYKNTGDERFLESATSFSADGFARRVNVPIQLSIGMIDKTCTPLSIMQWFNRIPAEDKTAVFVPGMGHGFDNDYDALTAAFLKKHLEK